MVEWEQTPVRKINGFEGTEKYRICYISEINHYIRGWGPGTAPDSNNYVLKMHYNELKALIIPIGFV